MNDLEELFNRQPPYTDEDLTLVIAKMRELRAQYDTGVKPKKAEGPKAKAIDLSEIGLSAAPKPKTQGIKLGGR